MKIGELLNLLAQKAGIDMADKALIAALQNPQLAEVELETGLVNTLKSKLMGVNEAQNSPELLKHFRGTLLGSLDSRLKKDLAEIGFAENEINALFEAEKNSFELPAKALKLLKEKLSKETKDGSEDSGKKLAELQTLVNELKSAQAKIKAEAEERVKAAQAEIENVRLQSVLTSEFAKLPRNPTISEDIWQDMATVALNKVMAEHNAKLMLNEGKPLVRQVTAEGNQLAVIQDGKELGLSDLIALAGNKYGLIAKSEGNKTAEKAPVAANPQHTQGQPQNALDAQAQAAFAARMAEAMGQSK